LPFGHTSNTGNERSPLLDHNNNGHTRQTSFQKFKVMLSAEGQPAYGSSFKWILFNSWWNVLLVFIPLSFLSHHLNWDAGLRFGFSFFAIMPLAKVCLSFVYETLFLRIVCSFWNLG
jgi:Ca2+:H+ antiporter